MTAERRPHKRRKPSNLFLPHKKDTWYKAQKREKLPMVAKNVYVDRPDVGWVDDSEINNRLIASRYAKWDEGSAELGWGTTVYYNCGCQVKTDLQGTEYYLRTCQSHPDGMYPYYDSSGQDHTAQRRQKTKPSVENTLYYDSTYTSAWACGDCGQPLEGRIEGAWPKKEGGHIIGHTIKATESCPAHGPQRWPKWPVDATKVVIN